MTKVCVIGSNYLVLSRLDYANSLLLGAREVDLKRLQRLQNKAARLVFSCGRDQPSAGLLRELHWLPVKQRIHYKILLYVYKCLLSDAPRYLMDLVTTHRSQHLLDCQRRLRSFSDHTRLSVGRSKKKMGDSYFIMGAPRLGISYLLIWEKPYRSWHSSDCWKLSSSPTINISFFDIPCILCLIIVRRSVLCRARYKCLYYYYYYYYYN